VVVPAFPPDAMVPPVGPDPPELEQPAKHTPNNATKNNGSLRMVISSNVCRNSDP
jgi:hypothetical protein